MKLKAILIAGAATLGLSAQASAAVTTNLLTNADFESGDTGFTSEFVSSPGNIFGAQTYDVVTDPRSVHGSALSYGDHSTGSSLMMAVNGSTNSDAVVWAQSVAVTAGTNYEFSAWLSTWFGPGSVQLRINGVNVGAAESTPSTNGIWEQMVRQWYSGSSTTALLELLNPTTAFAGNDFALDDLSFGSLGSGNAVPIPAAAFLFVPALAAMGLTRRKIR